MLVINTFLGDTCLCNNFEQWETARDKRLNRKYKSTFKWINLRRFKHKPVWNCLHERFTPGLHCARVGSTPVQPSNRRLWNRRIDACINIDSTVSQALIRLLYNCWLDGCTSVESTIVQVSNRRSQLSNRWLFWLFWKKSIKIFRCPFSATEGTNGY